MHAFITGGLGYIGSHLISELLNIGYSVTIFDCAHCNAYDNDARVRYIKGDLGNAIDVHRAIAQTRPTDIFHLGAVLGYLCDADPLKSWQVNFWSTAVLLDAVKSYGGKFFMLSSEAVFAMDAGEPAPDDAVKNCPNIYGQTKLAGEHLMRWYHEQHGVDARGLRFPWIIGPGRSNGFTSMYSAMVDAIAEGRDFEVIGPENKGSWLYIKDAVKAILTFHAFPALGSRRVYNIGGDLLSVGELAELAVSLRPGSRLTFVPQDTKKNTPYPNSLDDTLAQNDWGWSPDYPMPKALHDHFAVVDARRPPQEGPASPGSRTG